MKPSIASPAPLVLVPLALAAALLSPPAQAAPLPVGDVETGLTTFITIESRSVIDVGPAGSSPGDLTVTRGSVRLAQDGPVVGNFTTRITVIVPDTGSGRERRDTVFTATLPGGTLVAQQIQDDPTGRPPDSSQDMVVIAGSGEYAGARGIGRIAPVAAPVYRFTWLLQPAAGVDDGTVVESRFTRFVVDARVDELATSGRAAAEAGYESGTLRVDGRARPWLCGATINRSAGRASSVVTTCSYALPGGAILTSRLAWASRTGESPRPVEAVVVGGIGRYAGVRGTAEVTTGDPGRLILRLVEPAGQPRESGWRERRTRDQRIVFPLAGGGVGDLVATTGTERRSGRRVGSSASMGYTVAAGSVDERSTTFAFAYPGGTITAVGLLRTPSGSPPTEPFTLLVTGGTGRYLAASGTIRVMPRPGDAQILRLRLLT